MIRVRRHAEGDLQWKNRIFDAAACLQTQEEKIKRRCLLGRGRYPCVARGTRGRSHCGNVGRNLGAERVIHIVGVCGECHFRGAGQAKVGVGGRGDSVAATATKVSISEMENGMERE